MNCELCRELLPGLERAELETGTAAQVRAHVGGCADCARALDELRELNRLLDRTTTPSPLLRKRVMATLQREANAPRGMPAWFAALWPTRPAGAFAYSAALVLCGVLGGQALPPGALGVNTLDRADVSPERLIQLCAVPNAPPNDFL
jgi:anti-sigma factor RsiW